MNDLAQIEWGECWISSPPIPRDLAAEVKHAMGFVPSWATRLSAVPWVVRAETRVVRSRFAHMPVGLWDLISLIVSQDNSCRYCYGATRTILKVLGYRDDQIDRIERDVHLSELSIPEQKALEFARKVSHANPRPTPADREALQRAGYEPAAVAEIAYGAAFMGVPNRISTFFALPPEAMTQWLVSPLARLMRPLIARSLRSKQARPAPRPVPNTGPCADVIAALGDSPAASSIRATVDEALASPILPRRTKFLMLAVIGRALGCVRAEHEARGELAALGLGAADVDEVLANLGSAKLDRRDALLVPYARETVRYQTGAIQRHTRALCDELSTEEVIEAVGVASLANGVGRLSILLETC